LKFDVDAAEKDELAAKKEEEASENKDKDKKE